MKADHKEFGQNFTRRLQFASLIRIGFAVLLLLSTFISMRRYDEVLLLAIQYKFLLGCLIEVFVFSVFAAILLRMQKGLRVLFALGLFHDAFLAGGFILISGYNESIFSYLFLIIPLYGGIIAQRRGGVLAAIASSVVLVLLFIVLPHATDLFPSYLRKLARTLDIVDASIDWQRLVLLIITCFGVGLLTGQLSHYYERTKGKLALTSKALSAFQNLHEKILDALPIGIITTNSHDHEIVYYNKTSRNMFSLQNTKPKYIEALFQPSVEIQTLKRDKHILQIASIDFSPSPEQALTLHIIEDISSLKEAQELLMKSQRLSVLGEFSAKIAHEIKNPLACVSGCVEMLTLNDKNAEEQTLLHLIVSETERLNKLLGDILVFARKPKLQVESICLHALIEKVWALFSQSCLDKSIRFCNKVQDTVHVVVDETSFSQILMILWRNSFEAIDSDGALHCEMKPLDHKPVLQVINTGPKISAEQAEQLFEPFYSTKQKGTGLGLAVAKQLAQDNGCSLSLNLEHALCCFEIAFQDAPASEKMRLEEIELAPRSD